MEEVYAVIDLKSFYASCECVLRGLDIFTTPLVVADKSRSINSIVMSVTPYLKERYHVPNVCRIQDLPELKEMIFATPRMAKYVEISAKVVSIFLDFVDEEDLHVYSIDESFLHISPYLKLYNCTPFELVERIQKRIYDELGLVATSGLGPNMFLAKACLDNDGKKHPPYRAYWGYQDVPSKFWAIPSLQKVWGISTGISKRLHKIGIRTLESLAKADIDSLQKEFGIIGLQLHDLANGIDCANIRETYIPAERNLSKAQVLMRDYSVSEAKLILREMTDDLCVRLRAAKSKVKQVSCYCGYARSAEYLGFSRQSSLDIATDDNDLLYEAILRIFNRFVEPLSIRMLGIGFGKLSTCEDQQYSLLESTPRQESNHKLYHTIDLLNEIYGKNTVLRASSLLEASTIRERHQQIGGHKA